MEKLINKIKIKLYSIISITCWVCFILSMLVFGLLIVLSLFGFIFLDVIVYLSIPVVISLCILSWVPDVTVPQKGEQQ